MEPHELSNETQIRVDHFSSLLYELKGGLVVKASGKNQVAHNNSRWPWDTLHTMNIHSSILSLRSFNELNCIIEYAFDVLNRMILQMVLFIRESVFMIVLGIVPWAIDHMSDAIVQ
jgi:hypothetical protein